MAAKTVCAVTFFALIFLGFACLRQRLPDDRAALLVLLLVGAPRFVMFAGTGFAEASLNLFYFGALYFLVASLQTGSWRLLLLAVLFHVAAALTKNEGLGLLVLHALVLLPFALARRGAGGWRGYLLFVGAFVLLSGPYLWWRQGLPGYGEDYGQRLGPAIWWAHRARLPQTVWALLKLMTSLADWGGIWLVVPVALAVTPRRWYRAAPALLILATLGHFSRYVFIFVISPHDLATHLDAAADRMLIHLLPAAVLLLATAWEPGPAAATIPAEA